MNSRGLFEMSEQEVDRHAVIKRTCAKELKQSQAADRLGISTRQVKRLCRDYRRKKLTGILSKKRGKPSNRKISEEIRSQVKELAKSTYSGFGPTLMSEKLLEREQIKMAKETLRLLLIESGLWKIKRQKTQRVHQQRERRSSIGELVQIDGSPHDWFEGRAPKCCLIVFIDDASSEILYLAFERVETTRAYFRGLQYLAQHYGFPLGLYSDKHGIFRVNHPTDKLEAQTQFGRACEQLSIELINAHSPQAKGRVERANQTFQDRLVKELRLRNISDMKSANTFLHDSYRAEYNRKFSKAPKVSQPVFIKNTFSEERLSQILSERYQRKVTKNLELSFKKKIYQIQQSNQGRRLQQASVTICHTLNNEIHLLYQNNRLDYRVFEATQKRPPIADTKSINAVCDRRLNFYRQQPPAQTHPWRRMPLNPNKIALPSQQIPA